MMKIATEKKAEQRIAPVCLVNKFQGKMVKKGEAI
jgi:hypothetical protein